jgi:hypothetical protein
MFADQAITGIWLMGLYVNFRSPLVEPLTQSNFRRLISVGSMVHKFPFFVAVIASMNIMVCKKRLKSSPSTWNDRLTIF